MKYQTEFARLTSIQEELRTVAASMPNEDEVKEIIWGILSGSKAAEDAAERGSQKALVKMAKRSRKK